MTKIDAEQATCVEVWACQNQQDLCNELAHPVTPRVATERVRAGARADTGLSTPAAWWQRVLRTKQKRARGAVAGAQAA